MTLLLLENGWAIRTFKNSGMQIGLSNYWIPRRLVTLLKQGDFATDGDMDISLGNFGRNIPIKKPSYSRASCLYTKRF